MLKRSTALTYILHILVLKKKLLLPKSINIVLQKSDVRSTDFIKEI